MYIRPMNGRHFLLYLSPQFFFAFNCALNTKQSTTKSSFFVHSDWTDLENADWAWKRIFFQLSFLVEKLARFAVCREAVQAVVETILQTLRVAITHSLAMIQLYVTLEMCQNIKQVQSNLGKDGIVSRFYSSCGSSNLQLHVLAGGWGSSIPQISPSLGIRDPRLTQTVSKSFEWFNQGARM